jgi:hypothetical protein
MRALDSRLGTIVLGLICIGAGVVMGFAGVLMAWDARLHNAIVANTVENPWPGYLVATLGIGLIVLGAVALLRRKRSLRRQGRLCDLSLLSHRARTLSQWFSSSSACFRSAPGLCRMRSCVIGSCPGSGRSPACRQRRLRISPKSTPARGTSLASWIPPRSCGSRWEFRGRRRSGGSPRPAVWPPIRRWRWLAAARIDRPRGDAAGVGAVSEELFARDDALLLERVADLSMRDGASDRYWRSAADRELRFEMPSIFIGGAGLRLGPSRHGPP